MKTSRVFVWLIFAIVIAGYYLLWSTAPPSLTLSYTVARDTIIFNTFVALGFCVLVLWTAWEHIPVEWSWPRQVLYFLFISMISGVYNFNRLLAFTSNNLIKGADWYDTPLTGLIVNIQTISLLFALLITLVRYRFYSIK